MNLLENLDADVPDPLIDAFEKWHDWSIKNPVKSEAAMLGTSMFAWYAMPDCVKSSAVRFVGKSAILCGLGAYYYHLPDSDNKPKITLEECQKLWQDNLGHLKPATQIAIGVGGAAALLKVNSMIERYILHRGERRKQKGKFLPHVRQGLFLGALTGGVAYYLLRD